MGVARWGACAVVAAASTAEADIDWARGAITADGIGIADRHAPSPAAAREPARRRAEDAARNALAAKIADLPLASGGKLAARLTDPAIKRGVEAAIAAARPIDAALETDGSWRVVMEVGIEAVRQAIEGVRTATVSDSDVPVVIVEGVSARPALAMRIGGKPAATLWVREVPQWARDAPRVRATGASHGSLALANEAGGGSTLYVLVTR